MEFCFPNKPLEDGAIEDFPPEQKLGSAYLSKAAKKSSFYVTSPLCQDDVEQMKERAQKNKLFVYIKIPEVPINVSFKGEKEKNKILDVSNFLLQVPTIEYHNVTWTWFDLLLAVKSRTKDSLISQAIKQKLSIRSAAASSSHGGGESKTVSQDDEEKAKLLLGKVSLPLNKRK